MARSLFRGAPELSFLFAEAPTELLHRFLSGHRFAEFMPETVSSIPADGAEQERRDALAALIRSLRDDRTKLIEAESRRVTTMTDAVPDAMLRRLGEDARFKAKDGLSSQRDAVARSLWAYLESTSLFEAAERAMQVRVYRDHGKLYEAWSLDASIPLTAEAVDEDALANELAGRLQHEDGCKVEAVDLPSDDGNGREVMLAVTFFGAYSSQKTVRPDKTTEILYFRPPDELLLVYSPNRRRIEVCSRDATERRLVANIFATDTLKHDVSSKPLTQKTYNLGRFRTSLKLPIPEQDAHRVRRACITEVQVALGDWSRKVSLTVGPDDDIDGTARGVFGAIIPISGGGYITKLRFHIEHVDGDGRTDTLKFDVFGRNKSSIQSERDPAKRALGYRLLEEWGVLERVGDLSLPERREKLSQLLALYDLPERAVSGLVLDDLGIAATDLVRAGYLARRGWSDVILYEDDELGEVAHNVEGDRADGQLTLTLVGGGTGPRMAAEELFQFDIQFDHLRDSLRDVLKPIGLQGRTRQLAPHIHQVGAARIGTVAAPIYLARGLSDDKLVEAADRLIRGETNLVRGIVFVPEVVRFPYLGCHVVLSMKEQVDSKTGQVDPSAVRIAYEASIDPAARGTAVHFRKQGDDAAQIIVPGQDPRIITGPKKVRLFERLYSAHCECESGVKLAVLRDYAGFSQLPQLFGTEWNEIKDRYLYSPRWGYWALGTGPISA